MAGPGTYVMHYFASGRRRRSYANVYATR